MTSPDDDPHGRSTADPVGEAIEAGLAALPDAFRTQLGSVAIVVEDWPTAEQLTSVGARGLFGLYQGVPRTAFGADHAHVASKITIFRGPLERRYRDPGDLRRAIVETLHHELAHHLGISDARLAEIQAEGDPGP